MSLPVCSCANWQASLHRALATLVVTCCIAGDFGAGQRWTFTCPEGEVMLGLRIERSTKEDLDYEWGIRCVLLP